MNTLFWFRILIMTILNYQICFSMDNISLLPENNLGERLLTNEYENSNSLNAIEQTQAPGTQSQQNEGYADINDIDFEVYSPEKGTMENQISPVKGNPDVLKPVVKKESFTTMFKTFIQRQQNKNKEACRICYEKYTNNVFHKMNKCHPHTKTTLPCCMEELCFGCKDLMVKKSNGLEVIIDNRTPNDVVECIECPFCQSLVPQNEEPENGILLKIAHDSIKLHEQLALLQKAEDDVLHAMLSDAKNIYQGNFGYWPILESYIEKHDPALFLKIQSLNTNIFQFEKHLRLLQHLEFDIFVALITDYRANLSYWPQLRDYIGKHDFDLYSLIAEIELSLPEYEVSLKY